MVAASALSEARATGVSAALARRGIAAAILVCRFKGTVVGKRWAQQVILVRRPTGSLHASPENGGINGEPMKERAAAGAGGALIHCRGELTARLKRGWWREK